ncbi:MAG TPA: hypothetical protein VH351_14530 [Bryobacteraceae bacterium]|nr:hypothetical protein [Bryobacteraceae bacterium]
MGNLADHRDGTHSGARDKRDLATIDEFLSQYPVVPLSDSIGASAYRLLKTYKITRPSRV